MLQALLLTRDQEVLRVIRRVLETVSIDLETVGSADQARQMISRRKLDAVLVDCDDVQDGGKVVSELRHGKSNSKAIVFAITNRVTTVKEAFELGANFVLEKPVAFERAVRSLRAAHGLILRERRRYQRHNVQTTAYVTYGSARDVPIPVSNVSEGGLALSTNRTPEMKGMIMLRFELPGSKQAVEAKGEFVWSNDTGRVGVRFTALPPASKAELDEWISRQSNAAAPTYVNATSGKQA